MIYAILIYVPMPNGTKYSDFIVFVPSSLRNLSGLKISGSGKFWGSMSTMYRDPKMVVPLGIVYPKRKLINFRFEITRVNTKRIDLFVAGIYQGR